MNAPTHLSVETVFSERPKTLKRRSRGDPSCMQPMQKKKRKKHVSQSCGAQIDPRYSLV